MMLQTHSGYVIDILSHCQALKDVLLITIIQNVSPKGKNVKVFDGFASRG